jgi:hypothetical protein
LWRINAIVPILGAQCTLYWDVKESACLRKNLRSALQVLTFSSSEATVTVKVTGFQNTSNRSVIEKRIMVVMMMWY